MGGYVHTWTYDNAGNILERKEYAYVDGVQGNLTATVTYAYNDGEGWGDLLTAYNGTAIAYDNIGNPTQYGTWTYNWEHGRQLASMSNGTTTWNYTYNVDGLRASKTNGTTTYNYTYTGDKLTCMTVGDDTLYFAYDASGVPMSVTYNDVTYYYVTNVQGDVIALVNSAGTEVATYAYDAWGNPIDIPNAPTSEIGTLNPLRYRGYVWDSETKLYYLQSRYYNPEIGRFINADDSETLKASLENFTQYNLFAYCFNSPVNLTDETGTWPSWAKKAVAVVAVAAVVVAATAITVATCGAGSVAGVAMITTAATLAARATEVSALQIKKGIAEGKNGKQIAKDTIESVYDNGAQIVGFTPFTKSASIAAKHGLNMAVEKGFGGKQTLSATLKATGGKVIAYGFVALAWTRTFISIFSKDPVTRARERGYNLK